MPKLLKSIQSKFRKTFNRRNLTPRKILRLTGRFALYGLIIAVVLFIWYGRDLPTKGTITKRHAIQSSQIMDREGNLLYDIYGDVKRQSISFGEMPDNIKKATIAVEDKDFYHHFGFDLRGISRAVVYRLTGKASPGGGSTITQQFVKNALLSTEKTMSRKIKELILSLELEAIYSKDEILAFYLNEIPYGSNAYGIESASKTYFDKNAKDLTLSEAALLASIPQRPTFYSPYGVHTTELLNRKNHVLTRMHAEGFISEEEMKKAQEENPLDHLQPRKDRILAPHFVMYIRELLVEKYGEKMVEEGGLKVTTSLDPKMQEAAEQAVKDGSSKLSQYGASNSALFSLDPKTGQVLSMVGSIDYFDTENDGNVNVVLSPRQPGSSFKPIAYATAFKGKYNPGYTLFDVTTDFGNYTPHNYNNRTAGPVSIRHALANSLNIPAVKILYLAGMDNVLDTAHEMGYTTLNDRERYGLALVLGGGEVKLLDHARAYGAFANQGKLVPLNPILKVEDSKGKILEEFKQEDGKQVLDPQIAYLISDILSDNNARTPTFGFTSALSYGDRPVAVKTGTTSEFRDAWTMGYTPSIVAGVWVGNNDNHEMRSGADGSVLAAPILKQYLQNALKDKEVEQFPRPEGIVELTVEKFSNKLPGSHSRQLVKDIFASWQAPKKTDDINTTYRVCKGTNLLATDSTPAEYTEERVFANIHSEVPTKDNWENPVLAWARENGLLNPPPTEKCDQYSDSNRPSVSITSPKDDAYVTDEFTISADIDSKGIELSSVEFFLDNLLIGSSNNKSQGSFSVKYNSSNLSKGKHPITVKATNTFGLSSEQTIYINTQTDVKAPGDVTKVNITADSSSFLLSWTNPSDKDLSRVRIYQSTKKGVLGNSVAEVAVTPSKKSSYIIPISDSSQTYYFTFRTIDNSSNENTNTTQYPISLK